MKHQMFISRSGYHIWVISSVHNFGGDFIEMFIELVIIFLITFAVYILLSKEDKEPYVNITQLHRPPTYNRNLCFNAISQTLSDVLMENNIQSSGFSSPVLRFPCSYNETQKEVNEMTPIHKDERIFILSDGDQLSRKNSLWTNLVKTWGRQGAQTLAPLTYDLTDDEDYAFLTKEIDTKKVYILKKNIQRQKGLLLTQDKDEILNAHNNGYVIAQEVLQDPYLINGRKINLRVYLLIAAKHGDMTAWVYDDGFMYYTKTPFKKNTTEEEPTITTGYVDRKVYEENPLTHEDFSKYLDDPHRKLTQIEAKLRSYGVQLSQYVFNNIYVMINKVVFAIRKNICDGIKLKPYLTFQLFGVDVAIDDRLQAKIIEVNKGPDMEAKDKRDGALKKAVFTNMFRIMKVLPPTDQKHFIKIYE